MFKAGAAVRTSSTVFVTAVFFAATHAGCTADHATDHNDNPSRGAADMPAMSAGSVVPLRVTAEPLPRANMDQAIEFEPPGVSLVWKYLVLHHSATEGGSVASVDAQHRQRKDQFGNPWLGIGYHFVIGNGHGMPDGQIEPTFRWKKQLPGAHARSREHNRYGIGICLIGDFEKTPPTPRQLAAVGQLCAWLSSRYAIPRRRVMRHLDVAATKCPGKLFPYEQLIDELDSCPVPVATTIGDEPF